MAPRIWILSGSAGWSRWMVCPVFTRLSQCPINNLCLNIPGNILCSSQVCPATWARCWGQLEEFVGRKTAVLTPLPPPRCCGCCGRPVLPVSWPPAELPCRGCRGECTNRGLQRVFFLHLCALANI